MKEQMSNPVDMEERPGEDQESGITKGQKGTFVCDRCVPYLDCGNAFRMYTYDKTY